MRCLFLRTATWPKAGMARDLYLFSALRVGPWLDFWVVVWLVGLSVGRLVSYSVGRLVVQSCEDPEL